MSDTWSDIQATKNKQSSLREKLLRRKREREDILAGISGTAPSVAQDAPPSSSSTSKPSSRSASPAPVASGADIKPKLEPVPIDPAVEKQLLNCLSDISLNFPLDASQLESIVSKALEKDSVSITAITDLLQKFAAQQLISIETKDEAQEAGKALIVTSTDHSKLTALLEGEGVKKRKKDLEEQKEEDERLFKKIKVQEAPQKDDNSVESLLMMQSSKEREKKELSEEILQLLSKPTAKERSLVEKFRSQGGGSVKEFCQYGTREECAQNKETMEECKKLHFRKIIRKHTDESLGDCSFLNTCFHMDTCKYVHYEIDYPEKTGRGKEVIPKLADFKRSDSQTILYPHQWINCDLRKFDMSILGKCAVVMADPPWDIHMELPYGTMSDDEMRALDVPSLQDDGFMFLWVTGRAMELGRECLKIWGYERIDELIWVKTNQLQRIIRTGRTGHWLNHGKEHCLVGKKGNPQGVNKGLDADVIVAEVRATSHKPDEIYGIIERLSPGTRKVELFGRPHNVQPNWITLGNQLDGVRILDPEIVKSFRERYPDGNCGGSKK